MANPSNVEQRSEGNFEKLLLSFYHMGVPGMELWLSGLVVGAFTCQAILLALMMLLSAGLVRNP